MDKDRPMVPYIIVELKKPKLTDGKEQLKSYCNATGAPIGVWTNGEQIFCYNRKDPNFFEEISDIPKASQYPLVLLLYQNGSAFLTVSDWQGIRIRSSVCKYRADEQLLQV